MLVSGELNETVNVLEASACIAGIPDGTATRTESIAQLPLIAHSCVPEIPFHAQRGFPEQPGKPTPLGRGRRR